MNISILASIWSQNLWDELILKNEIKLLEKKYNSKNLKFRVFSYDYKNPFFQKENIEYLEYFPVWIKNPKNIFKNLYNFLNFIKTIVWSDIVVIWWWWIIYDNENQSVKNPLNQWIFRTKVARFFRKDIVFYWVWIDIKEEENIEKVKKVFYKAKEVLVRDKSSQKFLKKLWITSTIILDPVFNDNLKYKRNKKACIKTIEASKFTLEDIKDINFEKKKVWIAFRSGFFNNQKNKKLWDDLEILKIKETINYIEESWWKVILLPHSFHKTDILANDYEFLQKCKLPWAKIASSMQEVYNYYSQKKLDLCLAERLHSMIFSEVYNIPFVWFIYWTKTKELLK